MSPEKPLTPASLRGAVDLSSLAKRSSGDATTPAPAGSAGGAGGAGTSSGVVIDVSTDTVNEVLQSSTRYPVILALWSSRQPATKQATDVLADAVRAQGGRIQLGLVDIDSNPEVVSLFQQVGQAAGLPQGTPLTVVAFVQGQPMPMPPVDRAEDARAVLEQLVQVAVSNGITGRVEGADEPEQPAEDDSADDELSPLHQQAYDAIDRGDYDAAVTAYEQAVAQNPDDEEARLGLGQVTLLRRTDGVDLQQARADAAGAPTDVAKQTMVADLDVLGGHVEDAFARLVDLVRSTTGDERDAARQHLIGLFDVIGTADPRVKKARTALMSALY